MLEDKDYFNFKTILSETIANNPTISKYILDNGLNKANKITNKKIINDSTEFWNASVKDLDTSSYMHDNGIVINNVNEIPSAFLKQKLIEKLSSQYLDITNTKGVIFYYDSEISNAISNTSKFQNLIKDNIKELLSGEVIEKISIGFEKNEINVWGAIGKADIVTTYMDKDYNIISIIIDTYEFNKGETNPLVQMGKSVQDAGLIIPYFSVIPIKIPPSVWG